MADLRPVLAVEDDELTRSFLLDNLAADGFRVAGASGVGEGLRAMEVRRPALVVLDLTLEDGSGLALLDRVRAPTGWLRGSTPTREYVPVEDAHGTASPLHERIPRCGKRHALPGPGVETVRLSTLNVVVTDSAADPNPVGALREAEVEVVLA